MPRRKSRKKTTHRRSRRVSGLGGDLQVLLAATAGAVGGKILQSKLTSVNPKIIAGAEAALGLFLAKSPNAMLKGIGIGLFTAGGTGLAQSFNLISGIGAPPITFVRDATPLINGAMGAGYPEMPVVSGINGLYDQFS